MSSDFITNNPSLPYIAIVATGGTIAEKTDPKTHSSIPALTGEDLIATIPSLKEMANLKIINFSNIDSSQMTPLLWGNLSKTVNNLLKDSKIKGVVVTHGTDTMAEGAFFLDLTLTEDKPVVFTGAMKNASDPYSDGPSNILNAISQIIADPGYHFGVTVTLNQYINAAKDVIKTQTTNPQTFESGEKGYLGYIFEKEIYRFNIRPHDHKFPIPDTFPEVEIFMDFPGADGKWIRHAVDQKVDAIVVESVGAGNVSLEIYKAILYALQNNVIVVITTSAYYGSVYPIYGGEGGGVTLQKAGAILSSNLRASKARILLLLALPYVKKDKERLDKYFVLTHSP